MAPKSQMPRCAGKSCCWIFGAPGAHPAENPSPSSPVSGRNLLTGRFKSLVSARTATSRHGDHLSLRITWTGPSISTCRARSWMRLRFTNFLPLSCSTATALFVTVRLDSSNTRLPISTVRSTSGSRSLSRLLRLRRQLHQRVRQFQSRKIQLPLQFCSEFAISAPGSAAGRSSCSR